MYILLTIAIVPFIFGVASLYFKKNREPSTTLLFHSIFQDVRTPHSLSEISSSKFTEICRMIVNSKFKSIAFSNQKKGDDRSIAIIFDDGLKSNLLASEILTEYNLNATFFICSGTLTGESITDVYGNKNYLSREDIKVISERGFEIGSHSISHLDLTLLSESDLRNELTKSKEELENVINHPVTSLSFPYGIWNESVVDVAKEVGYKTFAVYNFGNKANQLDTFRATGVYPFDTIGDIEKKLNGTLGFGGIRASIIPHFAKGSPLAAFSPLYCKIPTPWFMHSKEKKKSNNK